MAISVRKKIGLAVLVGALVLAGFLIFYDPDRKNLIRDDNKINNSDSAIQGFQLEKGNGTSLGITNMEGLLKEISSQENLTKRFGDTLASGLLKENPLGIDSTNGIKLPDTNAAMKQSIEFYSQQLQEERKVLSLRDLKLSSDNSKKAVSDYYIKLTEAVGELTTKMKSTTGSFVAFSENHDGSYLLPIINDYEKLITSLIALTVPSNWATIHLQVVNDAITARESFVYLAGWENDPVRALIGYNMLNGLSQSALTLNNSIEQALIKSGLSVTKKQIF